VFDKNDAVELKETSQVPEARSWGLNGCRVCVRRITYSSAAKAALKMSTERA